MDFLTAKSAKSAETQRGGGPARLFWEGEEAVAESTNDPRRGDHGFLSLVLMPVQEELRLRSHDVTVEGGEADVNLVVAVVHEPRRVLCHEHIYRRESLQMLLHLVLLKQVITFGLVLPRAAEPAKSDGAELKRRQMKVTDGGTKRGTRVVGAFHGEDFATGTLGGNAEDDVVRQVATAEEKVGTGFGNLSAYALIVCNDQQVHLDGMVMQRAEEGN